MTAINFSDSIDVDASGLKLTNDGFLVGIAKIARAGNVQYYFGSEIGLTGDDESKQFGVYRNPDTVFDKDSMISLSGRPVTRNHPNEPVSSANWKDLSKGYVGGTVARDGDFIVAPMAIMDADAVKEIMDGARGLSAGYTCSIVKDSGVTDSGERYDYTQEGPLRFNHVAYLPNNNPRAKGAKFGDDKGEIKVDLKTVVLGDEAVSVEVKDAATVEKFKDAFKKAVDDHALAISSKDKEIGELTAKLKLAEDAAKIDIDKLVAERSEFIAKIKKLDDSIDTSGKTEIELMRSVVGKKLGADLVKDASDDMIRGMFLSVAKQQDSQTVKSAFGSMSSHDSVNDAHVSYINRMTGRKGA